MDAGEQLVEQLFREMRVDAEWSVQRRRGFTWWAGPLAQQIWADPAVDDFGASVSRVHVETDLLTAFPPDPLVADELGVFAQYATISGFLVGDGAVRLAASVFVHDEMLDFWGAQLTQVALIQVADAHATAQPLADLTGSRLAASAHPIRGAREAGDRLAAIRDGVARAGEAPSPFVGNGFSQAERSVGFQFSLLTTADERGLTSEVPFGNDTALFRLATDVPHPLMGNGLRAELTLPTTFPAAGLIARALEMNRRESAAFSRTAFLGSWCPGSFLPDSLSFMSFFPNACAVDGLPTVLLQNAAMRARWAFESAATSRPEEPRKKSGSAPRRLFSR